MDIFKTQPGPAAENATLGHLAGNRPHKSRVILCQLSYGGHCQGHGHEFNIYNGGNARVSTEGLNIIQYCVTINPE